MNLRVAAENDATGILDIYRPFIESSWTSFEETVPSIDDMAARIFNIVSRDPWIVADDHGIIAGYAYANPHRWRDAYRWTREVSVYLHPDYKGRGLGKQLYKVLFSLLKAQNVCRLLAGVALPNEASEGFHQRMGFELVGTYEKTGFKMGQWWDIRWFQLEINDTLHPEEPIKFRDLDSALVIRILQRDQEGIKKG